MTKPPTPAELKSAAAAVHDLERDRNRLQTMIQAARATVHHARRAGDDDAMRTAAQELSGLQQVLDDVLVDLETARAHHADLQAAQSAGTLRERHERAQQAAVAAETEAYAAAVHLVDAHLEACNSLRDAVQRAEVADRAARNAAAAAGVPHDPTNPDAFHLLRSATGGHRRLAAMLTDAMLDAPRLTGERPTAEQLREDRARHLRDMAASRDRARVDALVQLIRDNVDHLRRGGQLQPELVDSLRTNVRRLQDLDPTRLQDLGVPAEYHGASA